MPEMQFAVRWPDGAETSHYSPSLVMHDYLVSGLQYPLEEFVARTTEALDVASDRVRQKYGFACTSAMASQEKIVAKAAAYTEGDVTVLTMEPGFPGSAS